MEETKREGICREAVGIFGYESQERMAIEEMSELMDALMKRRRGRVTDEEVITEIADVTIMMEQLRWAYGRKEVDREIERKIERLRQRIENGDNSDTAAAEE